METLLLSAREQIEFYFSDANLASDDHMLEQMSESGEVSLSHLLTFRRMQRMFEKYEKTEAIESRLEVLVKALQDSDVLRLTEDKMRVGRIVPFKGVKSADKLKRTCAVRNLPETSSVDSVLAIMSSTGGKVLLVTFVDDKRDVVNVEFETEEGMLNACATLNDDDNWRAGLRVAPLSDKLKKKVRRAKKKKEKKSSTSTTTAFEGESAEALGWGKRFKPRMPRRQRLKLKGRSKNADNGGGVSSTTGFRSAKGPDGTIGFSRRTSGHSTAENLEGKVSNGDERPPSPVVSNNN